MKTFQGADINSVYLDALIFAKESKHSPAASRNGMVYDFGPTYFEFDQPYNQLLLLRNRKFNPYFAVVESAWVLSGKKDLKCLKSMIESYGQFSDDGDSLNGAYGDRMRNFFEIDQLEALIDLLGNDPDSRRAVITLYSPSDLLNNQSLDIPCNTTLFFKKRNTKLDITVINRSNDLYLGIPYNIFTFNVILKYAAYKTGLEIGVQRHFTDSLHLYEKDVAQVEKIISTNSKDEIETWRTSLSSSSELTKCLIENHHEIAVLDVENIETPYCKDIFKNYIKYKRSRDPNILISSLPNDVFGFSSNLWLNSFSKSINSQYV